MSRLRLEGREHSRLSFSLAHSDLVRLAEMHDLNSGWLSRSLSLSLLEIQVSHCPLPPVFSVQCVHCSLSLSLAARPYYYTYIIQHMYTVRASELGLLTSSTTRLRYRIARVKVTHLLHLSTPRFVHLCICITRLYFLISDRIGY